MAVTAPAISFTAPGRVEVVDVDIPDPAADEVAVRTVYSGVSQGTERWLLTGRYNHASDQPDTNYPCFPGYQAAGIVESVGRSVTDLRPGDHVMLQGTRFADPTLDNPGPGLAAHVGRLVAARDAVTPVSADVDLAAASLYRMAAVGRHGVRLAGVRPTDVVCVIGLGMIGQMAAQAARRAGAHVIGGDLIAARVTAAAQHSLDTAVNVADSSLDEAVRAVAQHGADVVIDTTGVSAMFDRCLELVRPEGKICLQGYYPDPISIDFHSAHLKRVAVYFPCAWDADRDGELSADLASGAVSITPLITHRIPYNEAAAAYEAVLNRPHESIGMTFSWL